MATPALLKAAEFLRSISITQGVLQWHDSRRQHLDFFWADTPQLPHANGVDPAATQLVMQRLGTTSPL